VSGRRPVDVVLVTGVPRSGTTVVGDVLAEARGARYLYEPLNRWVGMRDVDHDFPVPGTSSFPASRTAEVVRRIERIDLDLKPGVFPHDVGWRRVAKRVSGSRTTMSYRLCRVDLRLRTVVWKDPFAIYLAGGAAALGLPVIVTVRNPWAVAASFKRLSWGFDVVDVHRRLTEAGRAPSLDLSGLDDPSDPVTNAAAHWSMAHEQLLADQDAGREIRLVDLDAIVERPIETYEALYRQAGLQWTDAVAARVTERYASDGSARNGDRPAEGRAHDWRGRDVSQVNRYWQGLLTDAEAERVQAVVGPLWDATRDRAGRT